MPKYAYFNSSVESPSPVLGWYDTDLLRYPHLPIQSNLLELQTDQWPSISDRIERKWAVENGKLVAYTPPPKPVQDSPPDRIALLEARIAELEKQAATPKTEESA